MLSRECLTQPGKSDQERTGARRCLRICGLREHPVDPGAQLGRRGAGLADAMRQVVGKPPATVVEQHQQQIVLGLEVPVESLRRKPGFEKDVAYPRIHGPVAGDDPVRRLHQQLDFLGGRLHPSGERPGDGPVNQ